MDLNYKNNKYETDKSSLEKKISGADKKILIFVDLLKNRS